MSVLSTPANNNEGTLLRFFAAAIGAPVEHATADESKLIAGEEETTGVIDIITALSGASTRYGFKDLVGKSDEEKDMVDAALADMVANTEPSLSDLDALLRDRSYYTIRALSLADFAVFPGVYAQMANMSDADRFEIPNVTRWFDFIQHHPGVADHFPLIALKLVAPSAPEASAAAAAAAAAAGPAAPAAGIPGAKGDGKKDKGKKEKKKGGGGGGGGANAQQLQQESISRVLLKVGRITKCEEVEGSDKLYVETIDFGEGEPRTVVSGLRPYVPLADMQNRLVVAICNLKVAKLAGIESAGMVLTAHDETDENKVVLLDPPADCEPGDVISVEGEEGETDKTLRQKNLNKVNVHFGVGGDGIVTFKGKPWLTAKGPVTAAGVTGTANVQ